MRSKLLLPFLFASLLNACITAPQSAALQQQTDTSFTQAISISPFPFFAQADYQCGPAALATMLVYSGVDVTPEALVPLVYLPQRKGSFQVEMMSTTRSFGRLAYTIAPTLSTIVDEIKIGRPVLVLQNLGLSWYPRWHFAVVKGVDVGRGKIILNSGTIENYEMSLTTFELTWARAKYWAMVTLAPGSMPVGAEPSAYYRAVAALEETNKESNIHSAYQSGLSVWPTDREFLMGYGNLLYRAGNTAQAAKQYTSVIENHKNYAPAWNNLAQIMYETGNNEQAKIYIDEAISIGGAFLQNYRATLARIEAAQ